MYAACFTEFTLSRQGVASRVLRQAAAFNRAPGKVVYWLVTMADFGLGRTQLLPQGVPVVAYVTYQLRRAYRPARRVATGGSPAPPEEHRDMGAAVVPTSAKGPARPQRPRAQGQDRNYLLDQQQAIYDELVARRPLALASKPGAALPHPAPPSAAEITRDLAGWTSPLAGTGR